MKIPAFAARAAGAGFAAGALGSYLSSEADERIDQIDEELNRREIDRSFQRGLEAKSNATPKGRLEILPGGKLRMNFRVE